jgi:hypothetical protein
MQHKCSVAWRGVEWCGVVRNAAFRSAEMSRLFPRFVAYLHTPQICDMFMVVKLESADC